jgi:hypothetical protein
LAGDETIATDESRFYVTTKCNHLSVLYEHANSDAPAIDTITRYIGWSPHRLLKEPHDAITQQMEQWMDREAATYVVRPFDGEEAAASPAEGSISIPDK